MRIAVVSTDGKEVNEHFGRADRFLIYELTSSGPVLVEERKAEPLSTGDREHDWDQDRFDGILGAIRDCRRVYVTRIGAKPSAELLKVGLVPVVCSGPIAAIST